MNLQPLGDRLIVEVLDEEELTMSGIVLPDTAREKPGDFVVTRGAVALTPDPPRCGERMLPLGCIRGRRPRSCWFASPAVPRALAGCRSSNRRRHPEAAKSPA